MRKKMAALAAGLLMATGVVLATATPASAAPCTWPWTNPSGGTATTHGSGVNYRTGGNVGCDPIGSWNSGSSLYLHCWANGSQVGPTTVWWHARKANTQQQGWITAYYLNNSAYVQNPSWSYHC